MEWHDCACLPEALCLALPCQVVSWSYSVWCNPVSLSRRKNALPPCLMLQILTYTHPYVQATHVCECTKTFNIIHVIERNMYETEKWKVITHYSSSTSGHGIITLQMNLKQPSSYHSHITNAHHEFYYMENLILKKQYYGSSLLAVKMCSFNYSFYQILNNNDFFKY